MATPSRPDESPSTIGRDREATGEGRPGVSLPPDEDAAIVDIHGSRIDREGREWALRTPADGGWRTISRHGSQEQAEAARRALNASSPAVDDHSGS